MMSMNALHSTTDSKQFNMYFLTHWVKTMPIENVYTKLKGYKF